MVDARSTEQATQPGPRASDDDEPAADTGKLLELCEACGSEGRIYHGGYGFNPSTGDEIGGWSEECPECEGTGRAWVDAEPLDEVDCFQGGM